MIILMRYACLLGLGLASLAVFLSAGAVTGQLMIANTSQDYVHPHDLSFWVLGLVTLASLFSVFRFMFSRMPVMIRDWFQDRREKLATLVMAGAVCLMFVVL